MIKKLPYIRMTSFLMFLFCSGLVGMSAWFEFHLQLQPCPLCIIQRLIYLFLALLFFIGCLYRPKLLVRRCYYGAITFLSFLGLSVATRQVFLQHEAAKGVVTSCGPGLNYIVNNFPLNEAFRLILAGGGDCARVQWTLFSLSIAEWSLFAFLGICFVALWQAIRPDPPIG